MYTLKSVHETNILYSEQPRVKQIMTHAYQRRVFSNQKYLSHFFEDLVYSGYSANSIFA